MMIPILLLVLNSCHHSTPKNTTVVDGWHDGYRENISVKVIPSRDSETPFYLQLEAAEAFREMHAAAAMEGIELRVNSAYRTYRQQRRLFRRKGPGLAAEPGHSNHQMGLAVDIGGTEKEIQKRDISRRALRDVKKVCTDNRLRHSYTCPTVTYWWLYQNAHKFGFHQTLDHERWHWVYK